MITFDLKNKKKFVGEKPRNVQRQRLDKIIGWVNERTRGGVGTTISEHEDIIYFTVVGLTEDEDKTLKTFVEGLD